jgi:hypothetical protein
LSNHLPGFIFHVIPGASTIRFSIGKERVGLLQNNSIISSFNKWENLKDGQGRSYDDDLVEAAMYASYKDANGYTDKVAPGATLRTYVVFDVSKGLTGAKLTFSSGFRTIDFSLGF